MGSVLIVRKYYEFILIEQKQTWKAKNASSKRPVYNRLTGDKLKGIDSYHNKI